MNGSRRLRSIRFRILAAFVAALLAMTGSQAWQIWQQRGVSRSLTLISDGYQPLTRDINHLKSDRQVIQNDILRLQGDDPHAGAASKSRIAAGEMEQHLVDARAHSAGARKLSSTDEDGLVLDTIDGWLDGMSAAFRDYQQVSQADDAVAQLPTLQADDKQLDDLLGKLDQRVETRIKRLNQDTLRAQQQAIVGAGGLTAIAFVFATGLIVAILYALDPIARLTTQVQRLAAGDYAGFVEMDARGGDEIAILAGEFNAMVRALAARDRALVDRAKELDRLSRYLGSVVDSLEDGLVVVEGGRVTLSNPAALRTWGAHVDALPPGALTALLHAPGRHEIPGPDDTLQAIVVTPFGLDGAVLVSVDVTVQTRTRERLARSERLALVGQMLAQITHEVRNPLNALSLNAELLADELAQLDPDHKTEAWDLLAIVSTEIERLTQVTAHYLQLARRPKAVPAPEDLGLLIDDVCRLLAAELEQGGVRLETHCADLSPQLVDGNQIKQALLNVLRNAVEAGAHQLSLSAESGNGEVRLRLVDDGPGMTDDEISKACEPFFSTKATGTGLGLAITKQIVEEHDGTVRIASRPGGGTLVELAFPERRAPAQDLAR